jgi:hypothetical protein
MLIKLQCANFHDAPNPQLVEYTTVLSNVIFNVVSL